MQAPVSSQTTKSREPDPPASGLGGDANGAGLMPSPSSERVVSRALARSMREHCAKYGFTLGWTNTNALGTDDAKASGKRRGGARTYDPNLAERLRDNESGEIAGNLRCKNPLFWLEPDKESGGRPLVGIDHDLLPEDDVEAIFRGEAVPSTYERSRVIFLEATSKNMDDYYGVISGAGGRHVYGERPDGELVSKVEFGKDEKLKLNTGDTYLLAPKALHPNGRKYERVSREEKPLIPAEDMAKFLAALREIKGEQAPSSSSSSSQGATFAELAGTADGGRHKAIIAYAGRERELGADLDATLQNALDLNATFVPPFTKDEIPKDVLYQVKDAFKRWPDGTAWDTYFGVSLVAAPVHRRPWIAEPEMAEHFVRSYGEFFRYYEDEKKWMSYQEDIERWTLEFGNRLARKACIRMIRSVKRTYADPIDADHAPEKDAKYKAEVNAWHHHTSWKSYRDNVLNFAETMLPISTRDLDRDPMLIAFANGIFSLETCEFRGARREDYITRGSPVRYVPGARSELWERVLREGLASEDEVLSLQSLSGYLLTGLTIEELLFWFYGRGRNSKDTIVGAWARVLGPELAISMNYASLAQKKHVDGSAPSSDMARLRGARLAVVSEAKSNVAIDDERLKKLTGGNNIVARFMRENDAEFAPTHKFIFAVNDRPLINVIDDALRQRIVMVPFLNQFTREKGNLDQTIKPRLHNEQEHLEAIAAHMVEGYKYYAEHGLYIADSFKQVTKEYIEESNPLSDFIAHYMTRDEKAEISGSDMQSAYNDYLHETDVLRLSDNDFANALYALGVTKRTSNQGAIWRGLRQKGATQ
jgi:P4 family phage/plasmid primase-like protien